MKKLKFVIPATGGNLKEFNLPDISFKENRKTKVLLGLVTFKAQILVFLYILFLPFSKYLFLSLNPDSSMQVYLLIFSFLILGLYMGTLVLNGKKRLIDPPLFMAVLIFALGTTTASVMTPNPDVTNTFGQPTFRPLAGITVMALVALFYLINFFIYNKVLWKRAFRFLIAGTILYILAIFLSLNPSIEIANFENMIFVFIVLTAFLAWILFANRRRVMKFMIFLALLLTLYFGSMGPATSNSPKFLLQNIHFFFIVGLIPSLVVSVIFIMDKRGFVKEKLFQVKEQLLNFKNSNKRLLGYNLLSLSIILSPLIMLASLIIMFNSTGINFTDAVIVPLRENVQAFNYINALGSSFDAKNISLLIFGSGIDGYRVLYPMFANIISTQGILGVFSYLFLWSYGIHYSLNLYRRLMRLNAKYKLAAFLLFAILFIPIFTLLSTPSLLLIMLWWLVLALVSVYTKIMKTKNPEFLDDSYYFLSDHRFKVLKSSKSRILFRTILSFIATLFIWYAGISFIAVVSAQ